MSKRGRKCVGYDLAQQAGPFKCSECEFLSEKYDPAENHISREHQGLVSLFELFANNVNFKLIFI